MRFNKRYSRNLKCDEDSDDEEKPFKEHTHGEFTWKWECHCKRCNFRHRRNSKTDCDIVKVVTGDRSAVMSLCEQQWEVAWLTAGKRFRWGKKKKNSFNEKQYLNLHLVIPIQVMPSAVAPMREAPREPG